MTYSFYLRQVPAIVVVISAPIRWPDYGTSNNCWLSTSHGTIWAFIAPMLAIVAVNIYVFCKVMHAVLTMGGRVKSKATTKEETERYVALKKGLRASLSFLALLGSVAATD
jgi:hypothetical protein